MSAARFNVDLKRFANQAVPADFGKVKRKLAFDLYADIVERTRVDSGLLRASWAMSDAPVLTPAPEGERSASEASAEAMARASVPQAPFQDVFITNNLEYALVQELHLPFLRPAIAELEARIETS